MGLSSFRRPLTALLLAGLLAPPGAAQLPVPGNVAREIKITSISGGLPAVLDDGDKFGVAITSLGDLDGDGISDLAVGAYQSDDGGTHAGAVHILFMAADGSVASSARISATAGNGPATQTSDLFGVALAALGDLDGDGVPDLAVGAEGDDDSGTGSGAAYILFLNTDGTVKAHQKINEFNGGFAGDLDPDDRFGRSLANLGDLDGDGVVDLAVGAPRDGDGGVKVGALYVLRLNTNGTVKAEQKISAIAGSFSARLDDNDGFGFALCGLGDLDGDGIPDLAASAQTDDDGGTDRGAVYVLYLTFLGRVKSHGKISSTSGGFAGALSDGDRLGSSLALIGDLDGNGHSDLVAGARRDDNSGGDQRGAVWVLLLDGNEQVIAQRRINGDEGDLPVPLDDHDQFGGSVAALGDVDGDGLPDVAVGCTGDDDGGTDRGSVHALFLADGSWTNLYDGLTGSGPQPKLSGYGTLQAASNYTFALTDGQPLGQAYFVLGVATLYAPFKGGTLVPTPDVVLGPLPLDAQGSLSAVGTWPSLPSGSQTFYQAWLPDLAAPAGLAASNAMVVTQP